MNLTTFLELTEVKARFREEFRKPAGPPKVPLAAPPLTESYSLTGTAFDYLVRWYTNKLNPRAGDHKWVAEGALSILAPMKQRASLDRAKHIVMEARKAYAEYLNAGGKKKPGQKLIEHATRLAYLDSVFRAKILDEAIFDPINGRVVEDLTRLLELVKSDDFAAQRICVLNPTFGDASKLVGGADGDLILDETLIEFKTTKALELERDTFNQLLGYYVLSRIGGISGCPHTHQISRIAVYYSRYGVFWKSSVREVIDEKRLPELINWFRDVAERVKARTSERLITI